MLANAAHAENAQEFVDYLTSEAGQRVIADSYALEYTLNPAVPLERDVRPLADLRPPAVGVSDLDSAKVIDLMQDVGFL